MIMIKDLRTTKKEEIIDITDIVAREISEHKIQDGRCLVFIPHTTAGITINENADPSVKQDILIGLRSIDLESINFSHAEGNSPAHIKTALMGNSVDIIISNSKLLLGTWQGIYFCEFDGPRTRKFMIQF
jgi:secondary thiamine-phosphate synthase enzyme